MSRGVGALQRRVLSYLREHDGRAALPELAAGVLDEPDQRSRLVSLRRAVRSLQARGRVRVWFVQVAADTGAKRGVGLHVALERIARRALLDPSAPQAAPPPKRWARKGHLAHDALRRLSQQDVEKWLARTRTAKGYGPRRGREWDLPETEPPWIPYQLAARTMASAMGAVWRNAPLSSSVSRSIRRMVERLARGGQVQVMEDKGSIFRKYSAVRCVPTTDSVT